MQSVKKISQNANIWFIVKQKKKKKKTESHAFP